MLSAKRRSLVTTAAGGVVAQRPRSVSVGSGRHHPTGWRSRALTYLGGAPRAESEHAAWCPAWFAVAFVAAASYAGAGFVFDAVHAAGRWPTMWRAALGVLALATAVAWSIVGLRAWRKTGTRRSYL